jgi:hypothetical protein
VQVQHVYVPVPVEVDAGLHAVQIPFTKYAVGPHIQVFDIGLQTNKLFAHIHDMLLLAVVLDVLYAFYGHAVQAPDIKKLVGAEQTHMFHVGSHLNK